MIETWPEQKLVAFLTSPDPDWLAEILNDAHQCRLTTVGDRVYLRGLIEFSNLCACNCFYCGIRRDNYKIVRYRLNREEIIELALQACRGGLHSLVLQSGEVATQKQVDFLAQLIREVQAASQALDPAGQELGITLSIGELSYQQYRQLREAGAHRYLLRIETSDPQLFRILHPPPQSFSHRLDCLAALKELGFQVGTGVMIGLPGQEAIHLVRDLKFFLEQDIDMLGMGPYIPHPDTPLFNSRRPVNLEPFSTTLKMLALARLLMPDINMVASTALQTINPHGLGLGLRAGANVVMPVLTPERNRSQYCLYENKHHQEVAQLIRDIQAAGFTAGLWEWGDAPHYHKRMAAKTSQ